MNSPEPNLPAPRTYKDVPLVPAVDPDDLKRLWNVKPPWTAHTPEEACSPGANVGAVVSRRRMIDTLVLYKLLAPWTHDEQLDDAVFRVAATFPLHGNQHTDYMIPGDELHPFDLNAFVQRLVEDTGIAHVWEPVRTKVEEGGRRFGISSTNGSSDRERAAVDTARQLLKMIWDRFSGISEMVAPEEARAQLSGILFDNFLIANADIVERLMHAHRQEPGVAGQDLLMEIEARARRGMWH